jgi:hypothetical protein
MGPPLDSLVGLEITKVAEVHDYVQIQFGDQTSISIYNRMQIFPQSTKFGELVGKSVISTTEGKEHVELVLTGDNRIRIDMRDEAYRGPEALVLVRNGLPAVVWN